MPDHADTGSEDDRDGITSDEKDDTKGKSDKSTGSEDESNDEKKKASLSLDGSALHPRFARCENCNGEFDVTSNERGDYF